MSGVIWLVDLLVELRRHRKDEGKKKRGGQTGHGDRTKDDHVAVQGMPLHCEGNLIPKNSDRKHDLLGGSGSTPAHDPFEGGH